MVRPKGKDEDKPLPDRDLALGNTFQKPEPFLSQTLNVWYIFTYVYHKNQPFIVDKLTQPINHEIKVQT